MDLIQTLNGEDTGIATNKQTHIEYELGIFQHWLTVGTDKNVPGLKEIHGWIRPVFGKDKEMLTLEMNNAYDSEGAGSMVGQGKRDWAAPIYS